LPSFLPSPPLLIPILTLPVSECFLLRIFVFFSSKASSTWLIRLLLNLPYRYEFLLHSSFALCFPIIFDCSRSSVLYAIILVFPFFYSTYPILQMLISYFDYSSVESLSQDTNTIPPPPRWEAIPHYFPVATYHFNHHRLFFFRLGSQGDVRAYGSSIMERFPRSPISILTVDNHSLVQG